MLKFVLLVAVAALALMVWWMAAGSEIEFPPDRVSTAPTLASRESPPTEPSQVAADRRPDAGSTLIHGRVRSADGAPIAIARVELVLVEDAVTADAAEFRRSEARCDAEGRFDFPHDSAKDAQRAVLIARSDGYSPALIELPAERNEWSKPLDILLQPGLPINVKVLDPAGEPAAGALVRQTAFGGTSTPSSLIGRLLGQEAITDSAGAARLTPLAGEQMLVAEKGNLAAVPWVGPPPTRVVLQLGASFTLEGTLVYAAPVASGESERRIRVLGQKGNLWRPLGDIEPVREGPFGPLRVPLDGIAQYRVRLEGAPVVPVEESFPPPRPGARHRVQLLGAIGSELVFDVEDEHGQPIADARCRLRWDFDPSYGRGTEARGGADGRIRVGGLPSGWVQYELTAPGFVALERQHEVPDPVPIEAWLARGGRIVGRCTRAGRPVTDFEILYWREGNPRINQRKTFLGREDGRFELDHLFPAGWSLHAATPEHPGGPPIHVQVEVDRSVEVEIELPEALVGGGRVLDAETGVAIADARIQPYSSGGVELSFPWGPPIVAGEDGTFELEAFVPGANYLRIDADGYAAAFAKADAEPHAFVDFGEIRLSRPQRLTVTLLGMDEADGFRAGDMRATTRSGHELPEMPFGADGVLVYEEVPPGAHQLLVLYPDASWARLQLQLTPGREWSVDFKAAGARTLDLVILDARGEPLPFSPIVVVIAQEENGILVVRFKDGNEDGTVSFAGIRADSVQVWVYDSSQRQLASRDLSFGGAPSLEAEIRLDGKAFRVRVIDGDEAPIVGATVSIRSAAGGDIHGVERTGGDGWASFFGIPAEEVQMDVTYGLAGRRFGVPIDGRQDEHVFVLEADGILELEVRDGDVPLAGVAIQMQIESGAAAGDRKQTGSDGRARFEALGEGRYHFGLSGKGCWPAEVARDLAPGEHAIVPVAMRRLGDLELHVARADGLPVSGATLDLRAEDLSGDVTEWIDARRVVAPTGLATDARGVLSLAGLPRGKYSWMLATADAPLAGSFELAPGRANVVRVVLPD